MQMLTYVLRGVVSAGLAITLTATCSGQTAVWIHNTTTQEDMTRIERALATRGSVDFIDTPLKDAIAELRKQFSVQMKVSQRRLEEAAISDQTPVSLTVNDVPLESILDLLLEDVELSWTISENILLISTPDALNSADGLMTRAYPVLDLIGPTQVDGQAVEIDFWPLMEVIENTIAPQSWDDVGGPGSAMGHPNTGVLIISQTLDIHRRIEPLLASLRKLKAEQQVLVRPSRVDRVRPARRLRNAEPVAVKRYSATAVQAWQLPVVRSE